ncbi:hypothetical protein ACOSQ2_001956 [Xanthoceras sorbifolium]
MVHGDPGGNHSPDDEQRMRAIATGVVNAAIGEILPQLNRIDNLSAQMEEILWQLAAMSHNGNMVVDQGCRGTDEMTHGPTPVVQYPGPTLKYKIYQNKIYQSRICH